MSDLQRYILVTICGVLIGGLCLLVAAPGYAAKDGRPFWTEKSSFIEGDDLFVVGVASNSKTVEEARKQAFENGKLELMNFVQSTSLEARGLVIETQMTFEEPQANGTVTVYRLLRVPTEKLRAIQDNLRTQTVAQEHALEKAQRDLHGVQQSLARKQQQLDGQSRQTQETLDSVSKLQEILGLNTSKIEQKQREVEQLLQQLSDKVKHTHPAQNPSRVAGTTTVTPITSIVPMYRQLLETEAKLDAQEAQLRELAKRAKERLARASNINGVSGEFYDYKFMDSGGDIEEITVQFAFNGLVEKMWGCRGNDWDSLYFSKKK